MRALLALLLLVAPVAAAHGALEAAELEVELLADEAIETIGVTGGYDVTQVFLGEAHMRAVGEGAAGDGLYFRATFTGAPGPDGASTIVIAFDGPDGPIERTIAIDAGEATSDFDALVAEVTADELVVERAFLSFASAGLAPGAELSGFRVATFSGTRAVDVAPGGVPTPAGPLAPSPAGNSRVVTPTVLLAGPGRYLDVLARLDGDVLTLNATSLLKEGSQHLELRVPGAGAAEAIGATSVSVGPLGQADFRLRLLAGTRVDLTSDVGGRDGLVVTADDGYKVTAEDGSLLAESGAASPIRDVPAPLALSIVGILAPCAFLVRRERA